MLDLKQQDEWLTEHIPHRVRAVIAGIPMLPPWDVPINPIKGQRDEAALHCIWAAIHEGRLAAIRWLIMFVGLQQTDGSPAEAKPRFSFDIRIDEIAGGTLFDLASPEAIKLAKIWKGVSQASSHATTGTDHPDVSDAKLAEALTIIIEHLERTIYFGRSINLREKTFCLN